MNEILTYLYSWKNTLIIYFLLCFLPSIYLVKEAKKFRGTEELNKKYHAFQRTDLDNWTLTRLTVNNFIFLFPFRMVIAWLQMLAYAFIVWIIMIGQSKTEKTAKWREDILRTTIKPIARIASLMGGVVYITYTKRDDIDYKKWLGPDWKPTFDGVGLQVSNHQTWLDITTLLCTDTTSYIADSGVKNIPGIGLIAEAIQSVYTVRGGTSEARQ